MFSRSFFRPLSTRSKSFFNSNPSSLASYHSKSSNSHPNLNTTTISNKNPSSSHQLTIPAADLHTNNQLKTSPSSVSSIAQINSIDTNDILYINLNSITSVNSPDSSSISMLPVSNPNNYTGLLYDLSIDLLNSEQEYCYKQLNKLAAELDCAGLNGSTKNLKFYLEHNSSIRELTSCYYQFLHNLQTLYILTH